MSGYTIALPELEQCVRIVAAKLGDDAVMMGAARHVVERISGGARPEAAEANP